MSHQVLRLPRLRFPLCFHPNEGSSEFFFFLIRINQVSQDSSGSNSFRLSFWFRFQFGLWLIGLGIGSYLIELIINFEFFLYSHGGHRLIQHHPSSDGAYRPRPGPNPITHLLGQPFLFLRI